MLHDRPSRNGDNATHVAKINPGMVPPDTQRRDHLNP
jgi:hypothetical protein